MVAQGETLFSKEELAICSSEREFIGAKGQLQPQLLNQGTGPYGRPARSGKHRNSKLPHPPDGSQIPFPHFSVRPQQASHREVTTAAIDNLQFRAPAELGSTLFLEGRLTSPPPAANPSAFGRYRDPLQKEKSRSPGQNRSSSPHWNKGPAVRTLINRAYLVLVALDDLGHPIRVPALRLETEEERLEWKGGERRRSLRGQRRKESGNDAGPPPLPPHQSTPEAGRQRGGLPH